MVIILKERERGRMVMILKERGREGEWLSF